MVAFIRFLPWVSTKIFGCYLLDVIKDEIMVSTVDNADTRLHDGWKMIGILLELLIVLMDVDEPITLLKNSISST